MEHIATVVGIAALLLTADMVGGHAQKPVGSEALQPFWRTRTMVGESVLFVRQGQQRPTGSLLFVPTRILSVRSSAGDTTYEAGRDYEWKPGARTITLPAGSRMVARAPDELRRRPGTQMFALTHRDGRGEILFGAGHEYADMQTLVTYAHTGAGWPRSARQVTTGSLPSTLRRLRAREPLQVALLGDSISTGCNCSAWANTAPFQPAWQDLLVARLRELSGAEVVLTNLAVGGTDTAWGIQQIGRLAESAPDLVILAFGMNDAASRPAADFCANVRRMIEAVRVQRPAAEFILVSPMLGNADWVALKQELFPAYRDGLVSMAGPGVAVADLTSVWQRMLSVKKDCDLTGNGVNHPNDFGHRVYAQALLTLFDSLPARRPAR